MKKVFILFIALFIAVTLLPFPALASDDTSVYVMCNGQRIYPVKNTFYLPSDADFSSVEISENVTEYSETNVSGRLKPSDGKIDISGMLLSDRYGYECAKAVLYANGVMASYTFYKSEKLSSVYVSTSRGISWLCANKNNRDKSAQACITDSDGEIIYSDAANGSFSEIKGRGNASFSYAKKSFQLKLDKKTDICGMGKAKTWLLIANYADQSQLHNAISYSLAHDLGLDFSVEYDFVNLYVDGEYRGLYMICEKVQIDKERVNISELEKANEKANPDISDFSKLPIKTVKTGDLINNSAIVSYSYCEIQNDPDDITGGYLVELDNIWNSSEPCKFTTENGNTYVVKSPEYASKAEMEYIAKLFADAEEAIYSSTGYNYGGRHFGEYMDVASLAKVYSIQELIKNWDSYISSTFFYKDSDNGGSTQLIYAGPLWDCDNTFGNIHIQDFDTDFKDLWAQTGQCGYTRTFAERLMSHPEFAETATGYYSKAVSYITEYIGNDGLCEKLISVNSASIAMDRIRWRLSENVIWPRNSDETRKVSTPFVWFPVYSDGTDAGTSTAVGYLKSFIKRRIEGLSDTLGSYKAGNGYYKIILPSSFSGMYAGAEIFGSGKTAFIRADKGLGDYVLKTESGKVISLSVREEYPSVYFFEMPDENVVLTLKSEPETTQTETVTTVSPETETATSHETAETTSYESTSKMTESTETTSHEVIHTQEPIVMTVIVIATAAVLIILILVFAGKKDKR